MTNMLRLCGRLPVLLASRVTLTLTFILVLAVTVPQSAQAQTPFTTLYSFQGGTNGAEPQGPLILDDSGNLYGTTRQGGAYGGGTVFELAPTGAKTVLYAFPRGNGPAPGLVRDDAGNLYGVLYSDDGSGATVFKIDLSGQLTVLYTFCCSDPQGGLALDGSGNLYGTTGKIDADYGMVYKLTPAGELTILYSFTGLPDGAYPNGYLVVDKAGNLFGTTNEGGAGPCWYSGCGTVFKVTPEGNESIIYRFLDFPDGALPAAGVILGAGADYYGTTLAGGAQGCEMYSDLEGCGTVFRVNLSGRENILYRFRQDKGEGVPTGGVIKDPEGNLYGLTWWGTIFKLDQQGRETVLHRFSGGPNGVLPSGSLVRDQTGNLYGATEAGGAYGYGSIFKLAP